MQIANTKASTCLTCNGRHGFTLIELLLVLAVLVTMFALAVPTMTSFADRSRSQRDIRDIRASLQSARQKAIDEGRVIRWDVQSSLERDSATTLETRDRDEAFYYAAKRDAIVAKMDAKGPLVFRPNGTAVDAKITLWETGVEIGSLYVVGATGSIATGDSQR